MFDKKFHDAVKGYFTFDGYYFLDDKKSNQTADAINIIKLKLFLIKARTIIETSNMIDDLLKSDIYYKEARKYMHPGLLDAIWQI